MRWEEMQPSEAVEQGDWIRRRLHPFKAYDVGSVIPTGFEAYARILHPAQGDGNAWQVRWSDIARWGNRTIHPEVQFVPITQPLPGFGTGPKPWRYPPRNGTLEAGQVEGLAPMVVVDRGLT